MADVDRIAAALRYQQEMDAAQRPATMNPNIAAQGAAGRALVAPPTSVMDERYPAWKRSQDDAENLMTATEMIGAAIPLAGPAVKGAAALGRYAGPELARGLEQHMVRMGGIMPLDVYHGTPHRFPPTAKNPLGEFDASKIGTGEGAQAYGHGLYLAENPAVSKGYQDRLSGNKSLAGTKHDVFINNKPLSDYGLSPTLNSFIENHGSVDGAIKQLSKTVSDYEGWAKTASTPQQATDYLNTAASWKPSIEKLQSLTGKVDSYVRNNGALYKVDLPDEQIAKMLDWNKPLKDQNPAIQKTLQDLVKTDALGRPTGISVDSNMNGQWAYERLAGIRGAKYASEAMREAGIPGIRYLDQGSRAGGGTSNFVVFDPKHMNIIGRE